MLKGCQFLKRSVALLLAVAITFLTVPVISAPVSAEPVGNADGADLIPQGNFEMDLTGWKSVPVGGYTGYLTWENGAAQMETEDIFSMEKEMLIAVNATGKYSLSFDGELSENAELSAYISYYNADGSSSDIPYERIHYTRTPGAQNCSGVFTVPTDGAQIGITFVLESVDGKAATAKIDNVTMDCLEIRGSVLTAENQPANLTAYDPLEQKLLKAMRDSAKMPEFLMDVSFDDGTEQPWTLWSGSVISDGVMTQSADSNGYAENVQHYAVEAGKTYIISAKIQASGRSQAVYWLYEYNANGGKIRNKPITKFFVKGSNGWVDFVSEYTPDADVASVQFHIQTNEGQNKGGSIQWDYIRVALKEEEPPVTEPEETEPTVTEPAVTEPPATEKPEFLLDVSFDDGTEQPWTLWSGSVIADGVMTQSADSNGYAEGSQYYTVDAGKTYIISAKIKASGRSQAVYWLYEYNANGGKIRNRPITKFFANGSGDWVEFVSEYTPDANVASVQFHIQTNEGQNKGGSIQWDYIRVTLKEEEPPVTEPEETEPTEPEQTEPPVTEPPATEPAVTEPPVTEPVEMPDFVMDITFDEGTGYPWSLWSGASVSDGVLIQSADSNGYAEGTHHFKVSSEKTYELTAQILASGRAQAIFWIWEYDAAGNQLGTKPFVKFYNNGSAGWETFTAEYTPAENVASVRFHLQTNEGQNKGGSVRWDSVKVSEKENVPVIPDTCVPPNGNFEQGENSWVFMTQGAGSYSIESDASGKWVQTVLGSDGGQIYAFSQQVPVKPDYVYTISYKLRVTPDSTENLSSYGAITNIQVFAGGKATGYAQNATARNRTDGWETVTFEFITPSNAETIRIDFMYANNPGTALWDDFAIEEKEAYEPVRLDAKYDHGGTEETASAENMISNGTFDNGVIQGWSPKEGIAAFRTENENGGVVQFVAAPGSYLQSNAFTIQGSSEYELTYYVKVENADNLVFIPYFFTDSGKNWKDITTSAVTSDTGEQWLRVQARLATPNLPEGSTGTIGFKSVHTQTCQWQKTNKDADCTCHGSGIIYLDDISLIRTGEVVDVGEGRVTPDSAVYNGTFDRYFSDPKTVDGWALAPTNPNHNTYIQNQVAKSGNAIAMHATGHSYFYAADFTVEPGNIYLLSYWVKIDQASGLKFAPYMNDSNYKGGWWLDDAAQPLYETTDGWVKITSAVSIPDSVGNNAQNPEKMVQLGFQVYEGSGVIYVDDVSLVKTDVDADNANLNFDLSGEVLYNWSFASYGGKGSVKPSNQARPGSNGVSAQVYNGSSAGNTLLISKKLPVKPNTTYEFSYWVKTDGSYDTLISNYFRQFAADGVSKATSLTWDGNNQVTAWSDIISPYWSYQVQGEVGWRQVTMAVTTGEGAHFVELRFSVNGAGTYAWIDDVSFRETVKDVNLDFETTSSVTGAPANWHLSMARSYETFAQTDTTVYHSGSQSYHILKDSLLENVIIESCAYIPVSAANTYEFSFWVSSRNCSPTATIRMNMQLYRADGTRIYKSDGNYQTMQGTVVDLNSGEERSEWTKVVTRGKPVDEAAYASISFLVSRGDAEVWIDDIFFNVVEDGTDCVVYYDDFHAVDQDGNTGDWTLDTLAGDAAFTAGGGGRLEIDGEAYIYNEMKQIATDYTYTIRGKYSADIGGIAELRFYDYQHTELEDTRVSVPLYKNGEEFVISFTAPSNSYTRLYMGSDQKGTITFTDVTVYMVAKSSKSADWNGFWVWYPENPVKEAVEEYRYFRYTFYLDEEAEYAPFQLTVDDKYAFYLNGEEIDNNWDAGQDSWANVASYDLTGKVKKGKNVIALKCYNLVSEAGLLFDGKFTLKDQSIAVVASNNTVRAIKTVDENTMDWITMDYDDSEWTGCKEYGQPPCSPWGPVFYDNTLYIRNAAEVVSTSVPDTVTAGRELEFTITLLLESPIEANFTPMVTVYRRNSINTITSIPLTLVNYSKPLDWPVGEPFEVQCKVSIPDYFESGKYTLQMDDNMLLLSGDGVYENKFLDFAAVATESGRDNVHSTIEVYNGTPTLMIDGQPMAAHFYLRPDLNVYLQTDAETRIYKSELELYITYGGSLYKGGCDPIWLEDGSIDYDAFDEVIYETLAANNDALVMVNFGMFAPPWWIAQNPDHELLCHNGSQYIAIDNEVSLASKKFRQEAGEVLRLLLEHMKEQSYYNRVFGLKIGGGQSYEWMIRGTGAEQGPDYSPVSVAAFTEYLQKKYVTVEALQEAWGNDEVTFETAAAPGWDERKDFDNVYSGDADTGYLARNIVDWNLFLNEESANTFLYYCQIAKEVTEDQIIVGGYNGYLWTSNSYDSQGMAHTAGDRVLDSEYVDWIASPISYNERLLGQSNAYMALLDTVQEHGKMYIAEQDNRTYLSSSYAGAPWDANWDFSIGQTRTVADTILQQKRDFSNAVVNGAGLWQYDMYGGWLDDDQIYQYIADAKAEYDFSVFLDRNVRSEVAVFVGDETYAYLRAGQPNMAYTLLEPMLMQQRKHLAKMGTSYDTYTLSTLLEGKVTPHKVNIIFSPFEITEEMNEAIDKYLKCNGQYVVWIYLPGISDGSTLDPAFMERVTGFDIGIVEEKSGLQVQVVDSSNVLTQGIEGLVYGNSTPNSVSPLAYIQDTTDVTVLGYNLDGDKKPGLGIKDMGDWTSIYSAAPCLDVELLRNILKLADCHTYSQNNEDVIYANDHYVALHSGAAGEKTITLPGNYAVYDVFEEKFISMDTDTITYNHATNDTHLFRLTTPNTYAVTARIKAGKGTLSAPGLTEVAPGANYNLTVTPNEGYEVTSILVNDESAELTDGILSLASVDENTVIEIKFGKKAPEPPAPILVPVTEYIDELVILPWPAAIAILSGLSLVIWGISKGVKAIRRKMEGGY